LWIFLKKHTYKLNLAGNIGWKTFLSFFQENT